ncbi:SCUB2-like protein, partial [Mya arenaria]
MNVIGIWGTAVEKDVELVHKISRTPAVNKRPLQMLQLPGAGNFGSFSDAKRNNEDECSVKNGGCSHKCENTKGSYNCSCPNGFDIDSNQLNCKDKDECSVNNGGARMRVSIQKARIIARALQTKMNAPLRMEGARMCVKILKAPTIVRVLQASCLTLTRRLAIVRLFASLKLFKRHKDECSFNNGGCSHACENTEDSFHCSCLPGFSLGSDQLTCKDENECSAQNGGYSHACVNTKGSYYCSCPPGFSLSSNQLTCKDVNECSVNNGRCSHACTNTIGSYKCSCPPGSNQFSCKDVNECSVKNGGCSHWCVNTEGSYNCTCPLSFSLGANQLSCEDTNITQTAEVAPIV